MELETLARLMTLFAANTDRGMQRLLATTVMYRMERASERAFRLSVEALPHP